MATLGERIKPSLKQSNPIAFNGINYSGTTEMTDQDWLNFAISNQFFYSPLDPATRFTYKVVYDDTKVEQNGYRASSLNKSETIANAKNAWLEATYHHMEYCQVFPKGLVGETRHGLQRKGTPWFTFYSYFPLSQTEKEMEEANLISYLTTETQGSLPHSDCLLASKSDYIANIKQFDHLGTENIETLVNLDLSKNLDEEDISRQEYTYLYEDENGVGATQHNLAIYNQAYYVLIQKPSSDDDQIPGISIDAFINYIERINDSLGINLPTAQGFYRYDKRSGQWLNYDEPENKVVN